MAARNGGEEPGTGAKQAAYAPGEGGTADRNYSSKLTNSKKRQGLKIVCGVF